MATSDQINVHGWHYFGPASLFKKNKLTTRSLFGTEFIAFKTQQGEVKVFHAYCPHLGAHIGKGGRIKHDRVICPFHGWAYDTEGACVQIPYCERIPSGAKLRAFLVREVSGHVFIDYHQVDRNQEVIINPSVWPECLDANITPCFQATKDDSYMQRYLAYFVQGRFDYQQLSDGLYLVALGVLFPNISLLLALTPTVDGESQFTISVLFPQRKSWTAYWRVRRYIRQEMLVI